MDDVLIVRKRSHIQTFPSFGLIKVVYNDGSASNPFLEICDNCPGPVIIFFKSLLSIVITFSTNFPIVFIE